VGAPSRIDGTAEQRIVEAASVAGIVFASVLVAAILGEEVMRVEASCEALARRRQILTSAGPRELPGGGVFTQYRFIHDVHR